MGKILVRPSYATHDEPRPIHDPSPDEIAHPLRQPLEADVRGCRDRGQFSPEVRPLVEPGLESRPMVGVALRRTVQDHRFVRLAFARTISVLGNGFSRVALAFGVLSLPDASPARLSIVLACQAIPQLVFVLVGGVVADRVSRYRLMVGAELLAGCAWLAITAMIFTGNAPLPLLGLAAVVAGVGTAMFLPALNGVLPEFVSGERLQSANALLRIGQNSAMVLGLSLPGARRRGVVRRLGSCRQRHLVLHQRGTHLGDEAARPFPGSAGGRAVVVGTGGVSINQGRPGRVAAGHLR